MSKQEEETVLRRVRAALNELEEDSSVDSEGSKSILFLDDNAGAPVIVVLANASDANVVNDAPAVVAAGVDDRREIGKSSISGFYQKQDAQSLHPGLERFPLAGPDNKLPLAPKACFMEPGRTCVSSGACEMRGF